MKKILAYLLLVNFNILSAEYTLEYNPAKIDAKAEYFIVYGSENGISTQFNTTNTKHSTKKTLTEKISVKAESVAELPAPTKKTAKKAAPKKTAKTEVKE